jgi:hypothetical protein
MCVQVRPVARDTVSKTRMMIQLTWISMSIPAMVPIRNVPGIEILLFMNVDLVSNLVFLFARAV